MLSLHGVCSSLPAKGCLPQVLMMPSTYLGILELGGQKMHCFDGHGLIAKLALKDGRAHFKSRYVRTKVKST